LAAGDENSAVSGPLRRAEPPQTSWLSLVQRGSIWLGRRAGRAASAAHARWLRGRARERLASHPEPRRLCFGSGAAPIPGWLNLDLAAGADVRLDLRFGVPLPDRSVERIYSEHVIEHFTLEEGLTILRECHRLLTATGVLRLATPDLSGLIRLYGEARWRPEGNRHWPELGNVDTAVHLVNCAFHNWGHRYLYDFDELERRLREAGFARVRRCQIGESAHADLRGLETRAESDLVVEASTMET
jgi:predicted SAM-dependent methyltransferase